MNTCRTCQHWRPIDGLVEEITPPLRFGACEAPDLRYGYTTPLAEVPLTGALIENDEGWGMWTRPEFGCLLHTPIKESE